jgi:hypothetical protein
MANRPAYLPAGGGQFDLVGGQYFDQFAVSGRPDYYAALVVATAGEVQVQFVNERNEVLQAPVVHEGMALFVTYDGSAHRVRIAPLVSPSRGIAMLFRVVS